MNALFTVSEITREIKEVLELNLPAVWITGEISNCVHHSSGHLYFTLKDERAQLSAVMWRNRNAMLTFTPRDGMNVNVYGAIRVYEKRGTYQVDVSRMLPAGIGDLQMAFEELKNKLLQEGLFETEHKKPIPPFPQRIGIITSQTGAALHDILTVLNRRLPSVEKILRPAQVQGEGAARDIVDALNEMNEYNQIDVIILGRGGGSLEDLWAFNEEPVARAIYSSHIPVITAIGHEVDYTISDFVADERAPTPSAAAELVVPDRLNLLSLVRHTRNHVINGVSQSLTAMKHQLDRLLKSYAFRRPLDVIFQQRQHTDDVFHRICSNTARKLENEGQRLQYVQQTLHSLHPQAILNRGYTIVLDRDNKNIIKHINQIETNQLIDIFFSQGSVDAEVKTIIPDRRVFDIEKRDNID